MALTDDEDRFLEALKRTRRWSGLGKADFHKLLFGHGSDSTQDRLERGNTPSKTGTPDARLRLARLVVEKTDCPPELFGLSELGPGEADRVRRELREEMRLMKTELLREIEKVRRAQASPQVSSEPVEGG